MASWENPVSAATFLSSDDLEQRSNVDPQDTSLIDDARSRTYDAVCIPLTTSRWRDRWREMCTMSSEPYGERIESVELRAETWRANPVFETGEVTITSLGMSFDGRRHVY
jgi:protein arginine N-methyltransferase 5